MRFGLSPNLNDLLLSGQANLTPLSNNAADRRSGRHRTYKSTGMVRTFVRYGGGNTANFSASAEDRDIGDDFRHLNMRNQAQTQQIEIFGSTGMTFQLGLVAGPQDADQDGLPTDWESLNGLDDNDNAGDNGANGDLDDDGISNIIEWLLGLNPQVIDNSAYPKLAMSKIAGGFRFNFPTLPAASIRCRSRPP